MLWWKSREEDRETLVRWESQSLIAGGRLAELVSVGPGLRGRKGCTMSVEEHTRRGASAQGHDGICLSCSGKSQEGQWPNGEYVGYKTKEIGGTQSI